MADSDSKVLRLVAIGGSVRPANFTHRALALAVEEARSHAHVEIEVFDPANLDLAAPGSSTADSERLQEAVRSAVGVLLATPEYHGSFSSVMKQVIENLGFPSVLATKPVALLGVAAGRIGAIKSLEHLRSVCSHVGALVLPGPVSIAGVQQMFDEDGNCLDAAVEKQIRGVATRLITYIEDSLCPRAALEASVRRS
ncbi:MAG: NADPH-dependent FMN reductase [Acidobacteriota bacterium]